MQPDRSYQLAAEGDDVYRQFVLPIDADQDLFIRGMEFQTDNPGVVHHMIIYFDMSGKSVDLTKNMKDGQPGYSVNDAGGIGVPFTKTAWAVGWAPGNTARFLPESGAFRLPKGAKVVLQVHYHKNGAIVNDRSRVAFHFADPSAVRNEVKTGMILNFLFDLKPGETHHVVQSSVRLANDTTIISVMPHMHLLGREMQINATLPDGRETPMILVNDWNFNWQETYAYKKPLQFPAGTKLTMRAVFDNSESNPRQPSHPPREVTWGEQTIDEMCVGFYQYLVPRGRAGSQRIKIKTRIKERPVRDSLEFSSLDEAKRAAIAGDLLRWYRVHKRDLPWRGASPYAVWVSEIMLQQTQVATVIPFFLRFLARFPTVEALASASIEDVLKRWAGLGYYARARNLHRAAQIVTEKHGGKIPDTPAEIEALPGIGRYTSGAILSIAHNVPRPIVDANVIRVLSRVFGLRGDPKSAAVQAQLWALAERLVPSDFPGDFNQGLMELGALICEPADPRCESCPLLPHCVAGNSAEPNRLPEFPPGKTAIASAHSSALIRNAAGEVLIIQRPLHGLWGGLWEFPRTQSAAGETPPETAVRAALEVVGLQIDIGEKIATVKHGVMHYKITLTGYAAALKTQNAAPQCLQCSAFRWEAPENLENYAFSSPQVLLRGALLESDAKAQAGLVQHRLDF